MWRSRSFRLYSLRRLKICDAGKKGRTSSNINKDIINKFMFVQNNKYFSLSLVSFLFITNFVSPKGIETKCPSHDRMTMWTWIYFASPKEIDRKWPGCDRMTLWAWICASMHAHFQAHRVILSWPGFVMTIMSRPGGSGLHYHSNLTLDHSRQIN